MPLKGDDHSSFAQTVLGSPEALPEAEHGMPQAWRHVSILLEAKEETRVSGDEVTAVHKGPRDVDFLGYR